MRPVRDISKLENFRLEIPAGSPFSFIRRDSIEPEPIGTIILCAFRVTGYDRDCDGSLMARLEQIDRDGETTGWRADSIEISNEAEIVVTLEELKLMFSSQEVSSQ